MNHERRQRSLRAGAAAAVALLLAACGSGGSGEEGIQGGTQALAAYHLATVLAPGSVDEVYPSVQLAVTEGQAGPLMWGMWDGALPPGMTLTPGGLLRGRPSAPGFFEFTVHMTNGRRAGIGRLALAIDDFGVFAQSGLVSGDAWRGRDVSVRASGQRGHVSFSLVVNESDGQLLHLDGPAGTVVYRAGSSGGSGAQDVIRATDLANGRTRLLVLDVRADPTASHRAEFGRTDVWYVNMDHKFGAHPYSSDMHAALVDVGLRSPGAYDMLGSQADHLAATWIRVAVLRKLNEFYLRNADGSAGAGGLPVSFPYSEPGPAYRKPAAGTWMNGAVNHFSELGLLEGRSGGVVGTAFVDDLANTLHENNTTLGPEYLGVFLNVVSTYFNSVYSHDELREEPVGPDDVDALRALLTDQPSPGGRYDVIRRTGLDFARVIATVVAHEIGHSLGLEHTRGHDPGESIMGSSAAIAPWAEPAFTADDVARLASRLPGPGRHGRSRSVGGAAAAAAATAVPAGGVRVCRGRTCNLRIAIPGDRRDAEGAEKGREAAPPRRARLR